MSERVKIKVNSLIEMGELIKEYNYPAEMYVPLKVFELVNFRTQSSAKGFKDNLPYCWFNGVVIMPPKGVRNKGIVDLSDAEVINAPP